jgi:stress-induced-phosphoprotein 1
LEAWRRGFDGLHVCFGRENGGRGGDSDGDDEYGEDDDGGALQRALEERPELASDAAVAALVARQKAAGLKDKGNAAFGAKKYDEAVDLFSQCVAADPTNEVFFSNRSAAYAALKRFEEALEDAEQAIKLKPRWAKGYARKGAAHFGLEEFPDAVAAYEKATSIEPDDEGLAKAKLKAEMAERQQVTTRCLHSRQL